jgi:hypothetical protein
LIFRARRLLNPLIYLPLTPLQLTVKDAAFCTPLIKKIEPGYRASESRKTVSGFIVIKSGACSSPQKDVNDSVFSMSA